MTLPPPWPLLRHGKIVLFAPDRFPTVDAPAIPNALLDLALAGLPVERTESPEALSTLLERPSAHLLVLPHGSAFPLAAWPAIARFLRRGGGLVVLGGAPFHQPVRREGLSGEWVLAPRQPTYARELSLGPAEEWQQVPHAAHATRLVPGTGFVENFPEAQRVWSLTVRNVPIARACTKETGLMRLEDIDGTPWRSPEAAALLLGRKVASPSSCPCRPSAHASAWSIAR